MKYRTSLFVLHSTLGVAFLAVYWATTHLLSQSTAEAKLIVGIIAWGVTIVAAVMMWCDGRKFRRMLEEGRRPTGVRSRIDS